MLMEVEIEHGEYRRQRAQEERIRKRKNEWKRVLREGKEGKDEIPTVTQIKCLKDRHASRSVQDVKENRNRNNLNSLNNRNNRQQSLTLHQTSPDLNLGKRGKRYERAELVQSTRRSLKLMHLDGGSVGSRSSKKGRALRLANREEGSVGSRSSRKSKPSEAEILLRERRLEKARKARITSTRHRALDVEIASSKTIRSSMDRSNGSPKTTTRKGLSRTHYADLTRPQTPTRLSDYDCSTSTSDTTFTTSSPPRIVVDRKYIDDLESVRTPKTVTSASETMSLLSSPSQTLSSDSSSSRDISQRIEERKARLLEKRLALEREMASPPTPFIPKRPLPSPLTQRYTTQAKIKTPSPAPERKVEHYSPPIIAATTMLRPPSPPPPPPPPLPPPPPPLPEPPNDMDDDSIWDNLPSFSGTGCSMMEPPAHIREIYELLEGRFEI